MFEQFDEFIGRCVRQNDECFTNSYIESVGENYDERELKFILRDLLGAGSETTATTLRWIIVYLANHPEWQKRVQNQVRIVIASIFFQR